MTVTSLSIVSPTDFHLLYVEAGSVLKGAVNLHLSAPLKDIRISLTFKGSYAATWPSCPASENTKYVPSGQESSDLVKHTVVVYDSKQKGKGGTLPAGFHRLEIEIDTKDMGGCDLRRLPPTFTYDARKGSDLEDTGKAINSKSRKFGTFQSAYSLKCTASWSSGSKLSSRKEKHAEAEVLVVSSAKERAKLLSFPYPSLIGNTQAPGTPNSYRWATPHRIVDKNLVRWSLTVPRRNCMAGDTLECIVGLRPTKERPIESVTLELRERATIQTSSYGIVALSGGGEGVLPSASPTRILGAVRELAWKPENIGLEDSTQPIIRNLPITVPFDAAPTINHTYIFNSVVVIRLTIRVMGESSTTTCTVVEIPIQIVAPDVKLGRAYPPLIERDESLTFSGASGNIDRRDSAVDMYNEDEDDCNDEKENKREGVKLGPIPGVAPEVVVGRFKVVYPHHAKYADEMDVRVGNIVYVSKSYPDGWSYGTTTFLHPKSEKPVRRAGLIPTHHLTYSPKDPIPVLLNFPSTDTPASPQQPNNHKYHHQSLDWRFVCSCEERYKLWMDCLYRSSSEQVEFVSKPELAFVTVGVRSRSQRKVVDQTRSGVCGRCRVMWSMEASELL